MFPGVGALEFESIKAIIINVLLGWGSSTTSDDGIIMGKKGVDGIIGNVLEWGLAFEEQERNTLHIHMIAFEKDLSEVVYG